MWRLGRRRDQAGDLRVGEPVDSIASHLRRLTRRLALAVSLAGLLFLVSLDRALAAEAALTLAVMAVVAVASWRLGPVERWLTVLLGATSWTAARLPLGVATEFPEVPWWDAVARLGALTCLALGVSGFREALGRLLRTEDALAARLVRERDLARRDRLTRLWNARYFHEALEQEISRCRRYSRPFGLLLIDLDGFKAVNDQAGHLAGDHVLQVVGRVLREACRATDVPARLGGDEFAVIVHEASAQTVRRSAERLVRVLADAPFRPGLPRVTASVGGIAFATAPASGKAAVAEADAAMYTAKRQGKNRAFVSGAAVTAEPVR